MHGDGTPIQSQFDFLVPERPNLFRVPQVAELLNYGRDYVYELVTSGDLEAHRKPLNNSGITITRRSVIALLAETAQYQPADFTEVVWKLALKLPADQRRALAQRLLS